MSPPAAPRPTRAAAIWQEKLDYLREQAAICADPSQRPLRPCRLGD